MANPTGKGGLGDNPQNINKEGRPKGSLDVLAAIRRKLEECPYEDKRTYLEVLVEKYIEETLASNDGIAIRDLIDRFNGKPKQIIESNNVNEREWIELAKELANEPEQKTTEDS